MSKYIGPQTRSLALFLAIGVTVCDGACEAPRDGSRAAADGARTVAVTTGSLAFGVPGGPRNRSTVPSGATVVLSSNVGVCASAYHSGDSFTATVVDSARAQSGDVIPAGALATFRVTAVVRPSPEDSGASRIAIVLDSLDIDGVRYPATAQIRSIATRRVPLRRVVGDRAGSGIRPRGLLHEPLDRGLQPSDVGGGSRGRPSGAAYDVCIPRRGRITAALRP